MSLSADIVSHVSLRIWQNPADKKRKSSVSFLRNYTAVERNKIKNNKTVLRFCSVLKQMGTFCDDS